MNGFPDMKAIRAEIDAKNAAIRARFRAVKDAHAGGLADEDSEFFFEACEALARLDAPSGKQLRDTGFTASAIRWPLTPAQIAYRCICNGINPKQIANPAFLYASSEAARDQMQREIDRAMQEKTA